MAGYLYAVSCYVYSVFCVYSLCSYIPMTFNKGERGGTVEVTLFRRRKREREGANLTLTLPFPALLF